MNLCVYPSTTQGSVWEYQYDGRAPFREIKTWCKNNLDDQQYVCNGFETIYLIGQAAVVLFALRWS